MPPVTSPVKMKDLPIFPHGKAAFRTCSYDLHGRLHNRGFALIVVLAVVVLLLALVIGFFGRIQVESVRSGSFQAAANAHNFQEQAINIVMAQIRSATSGHPENTGGGLDRSRRLAWVSQPGMLRTFDESGQLSKVYRLYSSDNMIADTFVADLVPDDWNAFGGRKPYNALWCDLNAPVLASGDADGSGTVSSGEQIPVYPILDPNAEGQVLGFSMDARPGYTGTFTPGALANQGPESNPAPMPVKWLYVLEDGQTVTPSGDGSVVSVPGATEDNPIVGRIAFWADDETAKINVNTAAGGPWEEQMISTDFSSTVSGPPYNGPGFGGFWATPIVRSRQEQALALNQPAQFEYQRYPGHPGTTFLSAALPTLDSFEKIYDVTPRYSNIGSVGGSVAIPIPPVAPEHPGVDRLLSSVEELVFDPERDSSSWLDRSTVERAAFFLTAHSRAPEVNLFNEPRICLWPLDISENKRTPFDQLIAFCDTINGVPYYFVRSNPDSPTEDLNLGRNREILGYLRAKTSATVPGFGGGSAGILGKYGVANRDQMLTQIFDYIRSTNTKDSSQGGTAHYFTPTGAIVPIYDAATDTRGFGRFPTVTKAGILFYGVGLNLPETERMGADAVMAAGLPKSNGDPYPPNERSINYAAGGIPGLTPDGRFNRRAPDESQDLPLHHMKMRAILLLEMFVPGQGSGWIYPQMQVDVRGLDTLRWWDGSRMFSQNSAMLEYTKEEDWKWTDDLYRNWGGRISLRSLAGRYSANAPSTYPLAGTLSSPAIPCRSKSNPNATFSFDDGALDVRIRSANGEELQQLIIPFPAVSNCPVPELAPNSPRPGTLPASQHGSLARDFTSWQQRLNTSENELGRGWAAWITDKDVVRAVAVGSGDFRLTAALRQVGINPETSEEYFQPHPFYNDSTKMLAHNFFDDSGIPFHGAGLGGYPDQSKANSATRGIDNTTSPLPSVRANNYSYAAGFDNNEQGFRLRTHLSDTYSIDGAKILSSGLHGDWDFGVGLSPEGPYINFPDEGNIPLVANLIPYLGDAGRTENMGEVGPSYFSPNRMMPSAVMFGSLPTGVKTMRPWQTLLFRPSQAGHPGAPTPSQDSDTAILPQTFTQAPDFLLLDLFTMPVVEPYAISEPLSTSGKINMNYEIQPFRYIERSTGIYAVLRSEQMLAISNADASSFKFRGQAPEANRSFVDIDETLEGFRHRFAVGDVFRSAAEVCSLWLVPLRDSAPTWPYEAMPGWWNDYLPTGDNARESSYARIYPRLTTQSNTFTVHYRVQTLRKPTNAENQAEWNEAVDPVLAERRGSTTIERYVDPNDSLLPDYIADSNPEPLDTFYRFRVVSSRQLNP